ncbi:MAG: hypothetical protein U7123_12730 [Potamolinea sp.]
MDKVTTEAPIPPKPISPRSVLPNPDLSPNTDPVKLKFATGRNDPFASVIVAPIKQPLLEGTNPVDSKSNESKTDTKKSNESKTDTKKSNESKTDTKKSNESKTESKKSNESKTDTKKSNESKTDTKKSNESKTDIKKSNDSKTDIKKSNQPNPSGEFGTKPSQINPIPVPKPHTPLVPSTELAKAVQVSGVMDVGGTVTAIVKESKENTSRSVSEGDYISNGAVRVKRIQLSSNNQPLVILEQNGVEVIKPISNGNGPVASNSLVE